MIIPYGSSVVVDYACFPGSTNRECGDKGDDGSDSKLFRNIIPVNRNVIHDADVSISLKFNDNSFNRVAILFGAGPYEPLNPESDIDAYADLIESQSCFFKPSWTPTYRFTHLSNALCSVSGSSVGNSFIDGNPGLQVFHLPKDITDDLVVTLIGTNAPVEVANKFQDEKLPILSFKPKGKGSVSLGPSGEEKRLRYAVYVII